MQATLEANSVKFSTVSSERYSSAKWLCATERPRPATAVQSTRLRKFLAALLSAFSTPAA